MFCHFSFDAKFPNSDHWLEYVLFPFCCVYVGFYFPSSNVGGKSLGVGKPWGLRAMISDQICVAKCFLPRLDRILSPSTHFQVAQTLVFRGFVDMSVYNDDYSLDIYSF